VIRLRGHTHYIISASFSADDKLIVTVSPDRTIQLWSAQTGDELQVLKGHTSFVVSACFSPDGARLVSASLDKTIRLWDLRHLHGGGLLRIRDHALVQSSHELQRTLRLRRRQ